MEITRAGLEAVVELAGLSDLVQKMHAEHQPDLFKYPIDSSILEQFFREVIKKDGNYVFLARVTGRAVGYLFCAVEHKPEGVFTRPHERVYIHHVSVEPEYRRKGVGRALMKEAERVASEAGIDGIALDTWAFNEDAQRMFRDLGYAPYRLNMWLHVQTGTS